MTSYTPDDIDTAMNAAWPWISRADQQYGTYRAQMERGLAAAADRIAARALNDAADEMRVQASLGRFTYVRDVQAWLRARAAEKETP